MLSINVTFVLTFNGLFLTTNAVASYGMLTVVSKHAIIVFDAYTMVEALITCFNDNKLAWPNKNGTIMAYAPFVFFSKDLLLRNRCHAVSLQTMDICSKNKKRMASMSVLRCTGPVIMYEPFFFSLRFTNT